MRTKKAGAAFSIIILLLVAAYFIATDQTGIRVTLEEDRFSVKALSFSETVLYADIESASTASDIDYGSRTLGSDTISIKTGTFRAPRFGSYRCSVVSTQKKIIIVKKHDGSYLVFNIKDSGQLSLLADRLRQTVSSQAAR